MSRKKFWFVVILVLSIGVLSTGVFAQSTEHPFSTNLVVGGGNEASATDIGDVLVWNDAESLYIQYVVTKPGWCILETHLQVSTFLDDIPQANGNPIPGQFENNDQHDCAADFLYSDKTIISKGSEIEDRKRIHRRSSGKTHR